MSNYVSIGSFGPATNSPNPNPMSNPLSYCAVSDLDSSFTHTLGQQYGPDSSQCQAYMSLYCANEWNGVCEYVSNDTTRHYPNTVRQCGSGTGSCFGPGMGGALTKGQILIRNTATEKYLRYMSGNCRREYEPFDPTVANSPLIGKWVTTGNSCGSGECDSQGNCVPIYGVDPNEIDKDPVMNKILSQPWIAVDILVNIYNNSVRTGELSTLRNTRLYKYFMTPGFQKLVQVSQKTKMVY